MKRMIILGGLLALAACGDGVVAKDPTAIAIDVADGTVIGGSYRNSAGWTPDEVKLYIERLNCASGFAATYTETPLDNGRTAFDATCS